MSKKTKITLANPVDVHVGMRVKSQRILLDMSQSELADELGITFQQVQKYENGKNRISAGRLLQIARVFGVSPSYFFESPLAKVTRRSDRVNAGIFDEFCTSKDGAALMRAFLRIKDRTTRHYIAKLVEVLVD